MPPPPAVWTGALSTDRDDDMRTGAAVLSIQRVSGGPIHILSVCEKVERLKALYLQRMASRIVTIGHVVSVVENAKVKVNDDEAKQMTRRSCR